MKPTPARQRRQAHRERLALGRALHQVRVVRSAFWEQMLPVPKLLRKHAPLLRHTFAVLGS